MKTTVEIISLARGPISATPNYAYNAPVPASLLINLVEWHSHNPTTAGEAASINNAARELVNAFR